MTEKEALARVKTGNFNGGHGFDMDLLIDAIGTIGEMLKSGQIIEVVRCKNCKSWDTGKFCMRLGCFHGYREPDDFCAFGIEKPESSTQEVIADNPTYPAWEVDGRREDHTHQQ